MTITQTRTPITGRTRGLLTCGVVAGPLFAALTLGQASTRAGFDPAVHPLSLLSLGPWGWLQTANFVISGLLAVAGAVGLKQARLTSRWGPILIGAFGVALVWGGVFATDPADGFPSGTTSTGTTVTGLLHSFAPAVAGLALTVACFVLARAGGRGWLVYSVGTALANLVLSGAAFAIGDFRLMLLGGSLLWIWPSVLELRIARDV
jgi:hypothetical protein